jgi:S-formylglutathione hydrolase FrmB
MTLRSHGMQIRYNCLKNSGKHLWRYWKTKKENKKLEIVAASEKTEVFPESNSN